MTAVRSRSCAGVELVVAPPDTGDVIGLACRVSEAHTPSTVHAVNTAPQAMTSVRGVRFT
ncbi:MAG: hypothetical protein PSX37_04390 [bacterium]|nr:hypothetical protein [bacterium]